jgi:hypothetical protein
VPDVSAAPRRLATVVRSPRTPRAGRTVTIASVVTTSDAARLVRTGRTSCTARAGNRPLRVAARTLKRVRGRAVASCRWRLPASLKGRVVRGTLAVAADGRTARRSFAFRVG